MQLIQSKNRDHQILEDEFFARQFRFSYSSMNRLLYSPTLFYKEYVLNQKEKKTDAFLVEGHIIHALTLEDDSFANKFVLSPISLPGDSNRVIVEKIFAYYKQKENPGNVGLQDFKREIIDILKDMNLHQSLTDDKKADKEGNKKTGDQKRLEKIITEQNTSYFEFLKSKGNKEIIDAETFDKCSKAAEIIKNHDKVRELLGIEKEPSATFGIYNELEIELDMFTDALPFGLKGTIDNLVVDVENKKVNINDIKTTGKTISEFQESVEYYRYWLQAIIYKLLAEKFLSEVINSEWTMTFTFIVIDKYNQVYPFEVSQDTLEKWKLQVESVFNKAAWHLNNRRFDLPYEFVTGQVKL